jgi:polyisoprenoid-binding protein YceI
VGGVCSQSHRNLLETVMSRKTTAALIAALGINFAMAGGAIMLANLNKPTEFDIDSAFANNAGDLTEVAGKKVDPSAGDLAIPLKAAQQGGNARVTFTCGKSTPAGREVHEGTWDQIAGGILFKPDSQELIAIEAVFDTRSLKTDAHGLTNTVTVKEKWFDIDNHPTATFTCDQITPVDAATPSHTHDLVGSFTLNGIIKPITIPAKLAFSGQSLTLDAAFAILRSDYNVEKRESSIAGSVGGVVSKVEDEVELAVRVMASPDPSAVISELAQLIEAQQEAIRVAGVERGQLMGLEKRLVQLEERLERVASTPAPAAGTPSDLSDLPKQYTDGIPIVGGTAPVEMVLVPGSEDSAVQPIYMSTTEITWKQFRYWSEGYDLEQQVHAQMVKDGLQPSILFGPPSMTVQLNDEDNPAMAMSLRTAKAFCKWLSEETGRRYRLPTIQEWQHALKSGGGVPNDLDASAWHEGNSPKNFVGDKTLSSPAGSTKPNSLGIYDMLGSVAEWVTNTGSDETVVGGTIFTAPDELTADWKAVADVEVWSASYPQDPKSRYWYSDFYVTGIRLVCESASVAANPPEDQ